MSTIVPTPVRVNDAELLRLAATPRRLLFHNLDRVPAFAPLILVCCILPAYQLLTSPSLNEESSLWGLRSLASANAGWSANLQPGRSETGQPLIFQPPLAAWLNGLVIQSLGSSHPLSTSLVSLVAIGLATWLATRCTWRIGGAKTALIAALLMCCHPQVLESAIIPANYSIGIFFFLASIFGLQRHLQRMEPDLSFSLAASGVAWGLSLLAIGPIALMIPLIFLMHVMMYGHGSTDQSGSTHLRPDWRAFQSTLIFSIIGMAVGGWWQVMMLSQYGTTFLQSWWAGLPVECLLQEESEVKANLCPILHTSWNEWLNQSAMLIPWMIAGLVRAAQECRSPINESIRRRYQLLVLCWLVTFSGRIISDFGGTTAVANTSLWNVAMLTPTVLLASLGFGSLIERKIPHQGEFLLMTGVIGMSTFWISSSPALGLLGALLAILFLSFGPRIIRMSEGYEPRWTEASWRRLLKLTIYGSLAVSLWMGIGSRSVKSPDQRRFVELKNRLGTLPEIQRISLIASRDPVPAGLMYLLRSRWPHADIVATEAWDTGLTDAMEAEAHKPRSRFLVLEWTRRDVRVSANASQAWQVSAVGNPMLFQGRRLSLLVISPKSS